MTPGWHFVIHIVQLGCLAGLGALMWRRWPARDDDVREAVIALDDDVEALWEYAADIVRHLYALAGLPVPDATPTDEHPATGTDTDVADRVDTWARQIAVLAGLNSKRPANVGRHRTEAAEGNVHQLTDGIETRLLPHVARDWNQSGGAPGEEAATGPKSQGEQ